MGRTKIHVECPSCQGLLCRAEVATVPSPPPRPEGAAAQEPHAGFNWRATVQAWAISLTSEQVARLTLDHGMIEVRGEHACLVMPGEAYGTTPVKRDFPPVCQADHFWDLGAAAYASVAGVSDSE